MPTPRSKRWPAGSDRVNASPTIGPCADTVGTRPPYGSGPPIRGNAVTGQGVNHVVVGTRYPANVPTYATPWSYVSQLGVFGIPASEPRIFQNAVRLLEFGGLGPPQTYVVSIIAAEQQIEAGTGGPVVVPQVGTPQAQTEGRIYTRLQAVIEWSTGTGTQPKICLDIASGVVFRVFGTMGRVWLLRFPGDDSDAAPQNVELPQTGPLTIPQGDTFTITTVQSSVQTNLTPQEGFPGAWQCTSMIIPGSTDPRALVPPFARRVQATQAPGGPAIPAYNLDDRTGQALGSLAVVPGTRTSDTELIPGGTRFVTNPLPAATSPASIVFDVSQF